MPLLQRRKTNMHISAIYGIIKSRLQRSTSRCAGSQLLTLSLFPVAADSPDFAALSTTRTMLPATMPSGGVSTTRSVAVSPVAICHGRTVVAGNGYRLQHHLIVRIERRDVQAVLIEDQRTRRHSQQRGIVRKFEADVRVAARQQLTCRVVDAQLQQCRAGGDVHRARCRFDRRGVRLARMFRYGDRRFGP